MKPGILSAVVLSSFLLIVTSGCTHMIPVNVQPAPFPEGDKLPVRAALVLNKELIGYNHSYKMMGDTFVFHVGPPLRDYASRVANKCFKEVDLVPSADAAFADSAADIVLVPRPVKSEQSMGLTAFSKVNITLVLEWLAKDRATQNTVWLKTITADASEVEGNVFSGKHHREVLMQKLFDDLNAKTYDAIEHAPELRALAH